LSLQALGLLTVFAKSNLTSLLYLWLLAQLQLTTYFSIRSSSDSGDDDGMRAKRDRVVRLLRVNMLVVGAVIVFESMMMIGHGGIEQIRVFERWKEAVLEVLCV
jgi:hypothetical protein